MLTELVLTHPCGAEVIWSAGSYYGVRSTTRRRPIRQCPTCFFGAPGKVSPVSSALLLRAA